MLILGRLFIAFLRVVKTSKQTEECVCGNYLQLPQLPQFFIIFHIFFTYFSIFLPFFTIYSILRSLAQGNLVRPTVSPLIRSIQSISTAFFYHFFLINCKIMNQNGKQKSKTYLKFQFFQDFSIFFHF